MSPVGSWFVRFLLPGRGRGVLLRGRSRGMCRRRAHRVIVRVGQVLLLGGRKGRRYIGN